MKKIFFTSLFLTISNVFLFSNLYAKRHDKMPPTFVYLRDIDPSIVQDIRYAGPHNFVGRPIQGYEAAECILTKEAAEKLKDIQTFLRNSDTKDFKFRLKVFDCYRPQLASDDFLNWSKQPNDQTMKAEFYPAVEKADFFKLGYVATRSPHSRGSTVDLTLVMVPSELTYYQEGTPLPEPYEQIYRIEEPLTSCTASYYSPCFFNGAESQGENDTSVIRFKDGGVDMATGYDCFDEKAHANPPGINQCAYSNRAFLTWIMTMFGFKPYDKEWWHFTLVNERYPELYFEFPILPRHSSSNN